MIKAKLAAHMGQLIEDRVPFVLATVVRARKPASVRPGDTALVTVDGTISGFVGGQCAESSVRLYALRALETGEPLLLRLLPAEAEGEAPGDGLDAAVVERNPCLSGGALEIFLEPQLPAPRLVIGGGSPIADALHEIAAAAGYDVARLEAPAAAGYDVARLEAPAAFAVETDPLDASLEVDPLEGTAAVVLASHGKAEEETLAAALRSGVPYVALVASRVRGAAVRDALDLPRELAAQLHTPAGLDIGARTPAEIAVSILAELIAAQHSDPVPGRPARAEATDPACGMTVVVTEATPWLEADGERLYFCGLGCREAYAARMLTGGSGA